MTSQFKLQTPIEDMQLPECVCVCVCVCVCEGGGGGGGGRSLHISAFSINSGKHLKRIRDCVTFM